MERSIEYPRDGVALHSEELTSNEEYKDFEPPDAHHRLQAILEHTTLDATSIAHEIFLMFISFTHFPSLEIADARLAKKGENKEFLNAPCILRLVVNSSY